jgi:hypothetical protein
MYVNNIFVSIMNELRDIFFIYNNVHTYLRYSPTQYNYMYDDATVNVS